MGEYGSRQRLKLWGMLGAVLVAAIAILVAVIVIRGKDASGPPAPEAIRIQVLDESGVPIPDAIAYVRRQDGSASEGARFDRGSGTLTLSGADRGARVLIGAPGCRITRIDAASESRPVILERGLLVRLRMTGDAPPLDAPLVGLLRVRPSNETAALGTTGETRAFEFAELMQRVFQTRDDEKQLTLPENEEFGFAISEDDASSGFRVPAPGTYHIGWGMLDERKPVTWYGLDDGPEVTITVEDAAEAQVFDVEVTRSEWNRTREKLEEMVERNRRDAGR